MEPAKRLCFRCLKPGHQSRQCKEPAGTAAKAIEIAEQPAYALSLTVERPQNVDKDGFTKVLRTSRGIPRPAGTTFNEIFDRALQEHQKNRYEALQEELGGEGEGHDVSNENNPNRDMSPIQRSSVHSACN